MKKLLIISFLLFAGSYGFGQVYISDDTLQFTPELEVFYNNSLEIFSKIESSEKVNQKLMEELSSKNQDKKNFEKRIAQAKECIKKINTKRPADCIYVITNFTENGNVIMNRLGVYFQCDDGEIYCKFNYKTKEYKDFGVFKKPSEKALDELYKKLGIEK